MRREPDHESRDGEGSSTTGRDRTGTDASRNSGSGVVPNPVAASADFEAVVRRHDGYPGRADKEALLDRYRDLRVQSPSRGDGGREVTPETYVKAIRELALADPERAGDWVGELVLLAGGFDGAVSSIAGSALDQIGEHRPRAFERWVPDLVGLAESAAPDPRFYGLRSLAQLAPVNPRAASRGVDTALGAVSAESGRVRKAAVVVLGEVTPAAPEEIPPPDREFAAALREDNPEVRTAAAMAAGRVLSETPGQYPRTADALLETVNGDTDPVSEFANASLVSFAIEAPDAVPNKEWVVRHLDGLDDDDLGVTPGTVASAEIALLKTIVGLGPVP